MADKKSQQLTLVDGQGAERMESGDHFGRKRIEWFEFNTTDEGAVGGALTANQIVELVRLDSASANRILGIYIVNDDLGTDVLAQFGFAGLNESGTIDKAGTLDDPTLFTTVDVDLTTARLTPVNVLDKNFGYLTDKSVALTMKIIDGGAIAITGNTNVNGYIEYRAD